MTSESGFKMSPEMQEKLICPRTRSKLLINGAFLESATDPSIRYPILDGIPVLIDDSKSIFSINDFTSKINTTFDLHEGRVKHILRKFIPGIDANIKAKRNYATLARELPINAKILVVGGSIKGSGMDEIYSQPTFEIIGSDVSFGPYTAIISDAHDIPFEDEVFDCVIVQAVLEHVLEPQRCMAEVYRVMKPSGIVYAETPFMQQVHMKQYDFTRFTHLGHRRLFRYFDEIASGPTCGPGMAMAWSYQYFLRSFASSRTM
ncbi:MAG: methyltransferase domain-containing protein, partial [bacterium]